MPRQRPWARAIFATVTRNIRCQHAYHSRRLRVGVQGIARDLLPTACIRTNPAIQQWRPRVRHLASRIKPARAVHNLLAEQQATMVGPDEGLETLRRIAAEFSDFCQRAGSVTESDTRAKVITQILVGVCGWPEPSITREEHSSRGYLDYVLRVLGKRAIAVEAKREGIPFIFPTGHHQRSLKLSGALLTQAPVREAIEQVWGYCSESGIRFAVASNGYAWIVFRAVRDDMPWREGHARIFPSLDYIAEHFTEFWNLLSYQAISAGALDLEFTAFHRPPRLLHRVIDRLFNADLPLHRNTLHNRLAPIIHAFFEDITDRDQLQILESCYVHTGSLRIVAKDIDAVITDSIPRFLQDEGTEPITQGPSHAGRFGVAMSRRSRGIMASSFSY
jgi:hypothetical protein